MQVWFGTDALHGIETAECSCAIGLSGHCGHVGGLLFKIAAYQAQGVKVIPTDIAKTSQPQNWHKPRGAKIQGKPVQELEIKSKGSKESENQKTIKSTLFNPVRCNFADFNDLHLSLSSVAPNLLILPSLSVENVPVKYVDSNVGFVAEGSIISYQQEVSTSYIINFDNVAFPMFPVSDFMINNYCFVPTYDQSVAFADVLIDVSLISSFEEMTRDQSESKLWHTLRESRITASKVGEIFKYTKDPNILSSRLHSSRHVQTAAMAHGIASEPEAAKKYCSVRAEAINLYPSGIVISPTSPWLAASPDRKVFDPSRQPQFGLLEIKCPQNSSVLEVKYLKRSGNNLELRKNHIYYYQILTQLAVTGLQWCDFFVFCSSDHHLETIYFDPHIWQEVKDKVDTFFFNHFLVPTPQPPTERDFSAPAEPCSIEHDHLYF